MEYSIENIRKIILADRNQRFIWTQYNFGTENITPEDYASVVGTRKNLEEFGDVFDSEIKSLINLENFLKSKITNSQLEEPAF